MSASVGDFMGLAFFGVAAVGAFVTWKKPVTDADTGGEGECPDLSAVPKKMYDDAKESAVVTLGGDSWRQQENEFKKTPLKSVGRHLWAFSGPGRVEAIAKGNVIAGITGAPTPVFDQGLPPLPAIPGEFDSCRRYRTDYNTQAAFYQSAGQRLLDAQAQLIKTGRDNQRIAKLTADKAHYKAQAEVLHDGYEKCNAKELAEREAAHAKRIKDTQMKIRAAEKAQDDLLKLTHPDAHKDKHIARAARRQAAAAAMKLQKAQAGLAVQNVLGALFHDKHADEAMRKSRKTIAHEKAVLASSAHRAVAAQKKFEHDIRQPAHRPPTVGPAASRVVAARQAALQAQALQFWHGIR